MKSQHRGRCLMAFLWAVLIAACLWLFILRTTGCALLNMDIAPPRDEAEQAAEAASGIPTGDIDREEGRLRVLEKTNDNIYSVAYRDIPYRRRAIFNLNKNLDILAPMLSHRRIHANAEQMAELDRQVLDLIPFINVLVSDEPMSSLSMKEDFAELINHDASTADYSSKAVIASVLVYMTHKNPALLTKMLYEYSSLNFVLAVNKDPLRERGGIVCGFSTGEASLNVLVNICVWNGLAVRGDDNEVISHEATHYLDKADGHMDGLPVLISPTDARIFKYARDRLFRAEKDAPRSTGLSPYAFTNEFEFLATTASTFIEQPALLKKASPELYEVYASYFEFYPAE